MRSSRGKRILERILSDHIGPSPMAADLAHAPRRNFLLMSGAGHIGVKIIVDTGTLCTCSFGDRKSDGADRGPDSGTRATPSMSRSKWHCIQCDTSVCSLPAGTTSSSSLYQHLYCIFIIVIEERGHALTENQSSH